MVSVSSENIPTIPEYYRDKHVFITGGSGFIGKVLIEKLLRSCPDIGNIYILLREKKGLTPQERISKLTNIPLFDVLKKQNEEQLKKIIPVAGDILQLGLGMDAKDRNTVIAQVSIIFHVAATVRFQDPFKDAILSNVRSTREAVLLGLELKNTATFVHVSTAYSNYSRHVIEEKIYPPYADWREAILVAEEIDDQICDIFSHKYISPLPNTYVFTKQLAEHVVQDLCGAKMAAVILRPSIVICTYKEPMPGWVDNFNGPFGLTLGVASGTVRSVFINPNAICDHVYVDNFAKALIIAAWDKATKKKKQDDIPVYNCCSELNFTFEDYEILGRQVLREFPVNKRIWASAYKFITPCWYYYFFSTILFQILPAIFLDGGLKVLGKKPQFLRLQRTIYIAANTLSNFTQRSWQFERKNYLTLEDKLLNCDLPEFSFRLSIDFSIYDDRLEAFKKCYNGARIFLLKESPTKSSKAIESEKRWRILDRIMKYLWCGLALYIIFWKYDILFKLFDCIINYF